MYSARTHLGVALVASMAMTIGVSAQQPQASRDPAMIKHPSSGSWMPLPDIFPSGPEMQVLNGDPANGPADFYFRLPTGYVVPWHFHTPIEKVFMDQGSMAIEGRDGRKRMVQAGDYIHVPARSPHRVTCTSGTPCLFFLSSQGAFDIHLVDEKWNVTRSWRASDTAESVGRR